jgi:hypothetical protein
MIFINCSPKSNIFKHSKGRIYKMIQSIFYKTPIVTCGHNLPKIVRNKVLFDQHKSFERKLEIKVRLAKIKCNPNKHLHDVSNHSCSVIWDEIYELCHTLNDIEMEINTLLHDFDDQ